ncbi:hypothetical protein ONO86_00170 [Micromonospora noduli]|nr:hypothetical protein ONO86_00170 [Micromonospora noduli]
MPTDLFRSVGCRPPSTEYQGPAPRSVTPSTTTWSQSVKVPVGIQTARPWAFPASTAAWNFAVESVAPLGSAPKSVTTSSTPEGFVIAGATSSKSARSMVNVGDCAVEETWNRIFVPAGWVLPNSARVSS